MKNDNQMIENFFYLQLCDVIQVPIKTIEIDIDFVRIYQHLIYRMHENETGGITIYLRLNSNELYDIY